MLAFCIEKSAPLCATFWLSFSAVSTVHVPSVVTAEPSFLPGDARWLNETGIQFGLHAIGT